jgi:hypothetical protein
MPQNKVMMQKVALFASLPHKIIYGQHFADHILFV